MDFKKVLESQKSKSCIISVEKFSDDEYGNIRIVDGNRAHYEEMERNLHRPFVPDSPYEEYFPKEKNFEDFCYRSAFLGESLHTYVELPQMGLWLNLFLLPQISDRENVGYCLYTYDVTPTADSGQRANLSAETSQAVINTCLKLRDAKDAKEKFQEVIDDLRNICQSDFCSILLIDDKEKKCSALCHSINPELKLANFDSFQVEDFYDVANSWRETLGDSTCVILKDRHDWEWLKNVNPMWYQSLAGFNIRNIVLFPLNYNGERLGYMWAQNFNDENTVKIKETLELTTFFIASEIFNCKLLEKLEIISSMDVLTGVMNRNTMNNDIDAIASGKRRASDMYAVVFADLNGLKRVNDEQGHDAGDELLKNATKELCEAFPGSDIYRAGGDEFMVLTTGFKEEEIVEKVKLLNEKSEAGDGVSFALGMFMVKPGEDIRSAMRQADERMYRNKNLYYAKFPERKYR